MDFTVDSQEDSLATALISLILSDSGHLRLLTQLDRFCIPDCWVGAGYIRNQVWDHLHGRTPSQPADIDVVYFDAYGDNESETILQNRLRAELGMNEISVKNQARMHLRNRHDPYRSATDAMRYWPETCTAVAVSPGPSPIVAAPFGLSDLFSLIVRPTSRSHDVVSLAKRRASERDWFVRWPKLTWGEPR